jgi:hypothetical protein
MSSILLYNLFPKSYWKELTTQLLSNVPHDSIIVNVTLDKWDWLFRKKTIEKFLRKNSKVSHVYFTRNNSLLGEVVGFENMRKKIDFSSVGIVTYMHSKGVTKPKNKNIRDWVELMRYFQIEKFDLCKEKFAEGYILYGVKLARYQGGERIKTYKHCDFWYGGTFVSCNLQLVRNKFLTTPCPQDYYGVEGFWGNLCTIESAFSAHEAPSLYDQPYPEENYKK